MFLFLVTPAWGTDNSDRLNTVTGYDAEDYLMDSVTGKKYSGGLDTAYVGTNDTPCFIKCEDGYSDSKYHIYVRIFDYEGNEVEAIQVKESTSTLYSQAVKVHPDENEIWCSYTDNSGDGAWYTVDADFSKNGGDSPNNILSNVTYKYDQPAAWEVEWLETSANVWTPFFAGKASDAWSDPHAIFIRNGSS